MSPLTAVPAVSAPGSLTAAEFEDFGDRPENAGRSFELDEGAIVELPRLTPAHGLVCGNATFLLDRHARRTSVGQVFANKVGVQLAHDPDTVRGPDVMYRVRKRTLAEMLARGEEPGWETDPPEVAVEVRSPHDRPGQLDRKIAQYLAAGVARVWVLNPADETLTVHAAGAEPRPLAAGDALTEPADGAPPGFACRVGEFFAA